MVRSRIKGHRKVRVGDLVPHEHNPRVHGDAQREALRALLGEIGFARSLLAYEITCPDCSRSDGQVVKGVCDRCDGNRKRLKLIDGHLRQQELDPDQEIDVEVLDVSDAEARKLLLSLDPLAQLADYDDAALQALRETAETDSPVLASLWQSLEAARGEAAEGSTQKRRDKRKDSGDGQPSSWSILIQCRDEQEQAALLIALKGTAFLSWLQSRQDPETRTLVREGLKDCKALIS